MSTKMMKCGHAANAKNGKTGAPVCVICVGMTPDAEIVDENPPDLTGRIAVCTYRTCKQQRPSSSDLAFFEYQGDDRSADPKLLADWQAKLKVMQKTFDKDKRAELKPALDKARALMKASCTRDQFYCGCMGWD